MKKKLWAMLLCGVLAFGGLTACGDVGDGNTDGEVVPGNGEGEGEDD